MTSMSQRVLVNARRCAGGVVAALVVFSAACTMTAVREAPIEDKSKPARSATAAPAPVTTAPSVAPAAPVAGPREASNGTYVVQRGDTLYSIAVAFGQDYRDIARWNNLDDPTKLATGQTLRVAPPEGEGPAAVVGVVTVNPSAPTETHSLEPQAAPAPTPLPAPPTATNPSTNAVPTPAPSATAPASPAVTPAPNAAPSAPPASPPPAANGAPPNWQWPAKGKVVDGFNETRNKGIDIAAKEGDAVLAASDGDVVYSGSGLRMYGNLVIVKHNDDFISAYAYNKQILVKQGQAVRRGQRIADVGKADDGQAKLHFEIRYRGKPVDPTKYLPTQK